jgi:hypothetical protein
VPCPLGKVLPQLPQFAARSLVRREVPSVPCKGMAGMALLASPPSIGSKACSHDQCTATDTPTSPPHKYTHRSLTSPVVTRHGTQDLTDLLRSVLLSSIPPADASARVSSACGIWIYVSLQLASAEPPLKAAKVLQYAEDTRYLDVLQKVRGPHRRSLGCAGHYS